MLLKVIVEEVVVLVNLFLPKLSAAQQAAATNLVAAVEAFVATL